MTAKVIFFVFVLIGGQPQPMGFKQEVPSLQECLILVRDFMNHPPHELLLKGGKFEAGCHSEAPPSQEH